MKFAVDSNHRDFFQRHQAIEFDALLNAKQLADLFDRVEKVLALRLKETTTDPESLFLAGRDLFRDDPALKKIISQKLFAEIAAELTSQKPIRLGYDQFIPPPPPAEALGSYDTPYYQLFKTKFSLLEISSLQGLIGGMLLCLKGCEGKSPDETPSFSSIAGNGVFLSPQAILDFEGNRWASDCHYLLIVYVQASSVYILNHSDPNTHALKNYGYALGDKLTDKLNPILLR